MVAKNSLNWDDIRAFLALVRNPRLKAAAKTLGINPTTLMRRMQKLGQAINATLFVQRDTQWKLTDNGKALVGFAEKAEAAMLNIQASSVAALTGSVKIAVSEPFSTWFLSDRLKHFNDAYPEIIVEIISPSFSLSLVKREVDVGILPRRPTGGPLTCRRLVDSTLRLYASRDYLDAHAPVKTLSDIRNHRIVGYVRDLLPSVDLDHWEELLPGVMTNIRVNGIGVQARAIASGIGLGLLPTYVAAEDPRLVPLLVDLVKVDQPFWLAIRQDVRDSQRVAAFVDWLTKLVNDNKSFFVESEHAQS